MSNGWRVMDATGVVGSCEGPAKDGWVCPLGVLGGYRGLRTEVVRGSDGSRKGRKDVFNMQALDALEDRRSHACAAAGELPAATTLDIPVAALGLRLAHASECEGCRRTYGLASPSVKRKLWIESYRLMLSRHLSHDQPGKADLMRRLPLFEVAVDGVLGIKLLGLNPKRPTRRLA